MHNGQEERQVDNFLKKLSGEVYSAKKKIEKLRKEDTLVFPVFTDLHTESVDHEYAKKLIGALKLITGEIETDAVINLGDNPSMLGRDKHITNSELKKFFETMLSEIYEASGCPIINVHGNHDAVGTDFFKADFWNDITKGKFGNCDAKYGEGSYYYVDFEKADTRLVALSMPYDSDLEAEHPTPLWAFGKAQLEWLKTIALDTEKDIIILCHAPLYYYHVGDEDRFLGVWTGENTAESSIASLCGWIEDCDEAAEIINSYKGNLALSYSTYSGASENYLKIYDDFGKEKYFLKFDEKILVAYFCIY